MVVGRTGISLGLDTTTWHTTCNAGLLCRGGVIMSMVYCCILLMVEVICSMQEARLLCTVSDPTGCSA